MIRPLTIATFLLAAGSGLYLYQSKHEVQLLDRTIERTVHDTGTLREQSRLLAAEWTMLNDPERLRGFSDTYLSLRTISPTQFTSVTDLDTRLPSPRAEVSPRSADEAEPVVAAAAAPADPVPADAVPAVTEGVPAADAPGGAVVQAMPVPPVPAVRRAVAVTVVPRPVSRPLDGQARLASAGDARPADPRGFDQRVFDQRPPEQQRLPDQRAFDQRPPDQRIFDQRPPEQRPFEHPPEQRAFDQRPLDPRSLEQRSFDQRLPDQRPPDQRALEQRGAPRVADLRAPVVAPARQLAFTPVRPPLPAPGPISGPPPITSYRPIAAPSGPAAQPPQYPGSLLGMARGTMPPAPRPTPVNATYNAN